jgi:hypothetical protein
MDTLVLPAARIHVTRAAWWTLPIFNAHLQRGRTGMGKQQQQCISPARCRRFTSRPLFFSLLLSLSHVRSRLLPAAYNTCSYQPDARPPTDSSDWDRLINSSWPICQWPDGGIQFLRCVGNQLPAWIRVSASAWSGRLG